jgi:hypothetical protein
VLVTSLCVNKQFHLACATPYNPLSLRPLTKSHTINKHALCPHMAQPQPPVPNVANINAAVNGMAAEENLIAQHSQAYNVHRQQLTTEMSLCANYPVGQMQQQLTAIQQETARIRAE